MNKGHGRLEKRHLQASTRLAGYLDWPGVQQVCRIERVVTEQGATTTDVSYAITSLSPERAGAEQLLAYNRSHWGIENRLHWVRDVCFGEDACRARTGHGPQNLAAFRNVALSLLYHSGANGVISTIRDFASRPYDLLKFLRIMKN